jgi:predicted HTH transcriptional regulator
MNEPIVQTESQLLALVDQVETIRLEFKRSALLADKREDYLKVLSKEISAFANTEGGQIVIGLEEEKIGKNKKAKKVDDGLDMSDFAMESFSSLCSRASVRIWPG